jgi:hypothetical protein
MEIVLQINENRLSWISVDSCLAFPVFSSPDCINKRCFAGGFCVH